MASTTTSGPATPAWSVLLIGALSLARLATAFDRPGATPDPFGEEAPR